MSDEERKTIEVACPRCDGGKWFPCFAHISRGVCFKCGGNGTFTRWANKYAGKCGDCGEWIQAGDGHTVRRSSGHGYVVLHAEWCGGREG